MADEVAVETPAAPAEGQEAPASQSTPSEPSAPQAEKAAAEAARKFRLKFGKQEKEVDEGTLLAMAQKGWAADERFQQAAQAQKQMQTLLQRLKEDPDTVLRHLGVENPTELYKSRLAEHLKRELLTPEQRELMEAKNKLSSYEKQEKARQEEQAKAQLQREMEHLAVEYDKEIATAVQAVGIPKTPRTVARMADLMAKNVAQGHELPASAIAEIVRDEYVNEVKEVLGGYGDEKLLDLLGPDLLKKVQTMDAKRRKAPTRQPETIVKPPQGTDAKKVDGDGRVLASRDEWREQLEKWKNS